MVEKIKSHLLQDNNVDGYAKKVIASNKISDLKRNDEKQDNKKKYMKMLTTIYHGKYDFWEMRSYKQRKIAKL